MALLCAAFRSSRKNTLPNYAAIQRLTTGASISGSGALVASQGKGQTWELVADKIGHHWNGR
jgi:hypothetical protein